MKPLDNEFEFGYETNNRQSNLKPFKTENSPRYRLQQGMVLDAGGEERREGSLRSTMTMRAYRSCIWIPKKRAWISCRYSWIC